MDQRKKILLIGGGIGAFICIRLFVLFSLLTKRDTPPLQTDINNIPEDTIVYSGIYVDENPTPTPIPDTPVKTLPDEATPNTESNRITVLLPPFIDLQEWQTFAQHIEEKTGIQTNYQYFTNRDSYITAATFHKNSPGRIDIIMIPTQRIHSYADRSSVLLFQKSIVPYFNSLFANLLQSDIFTFIPYAIDLPVSIYDTTLRINEATLNDMLQALSTRKSRGESVHYLLGNDDDSIVTQQNGKSPFLGYGDIIKLVLEEAKISQRTDILSILETPYRSSREFNRLIAENTASICKDTPVVCIVQTETNTVGFTFLSQIEHRSHTQPFDQTINNFPLLSETYPVTGRGFVVTKAGNNRLARATRIQSYLNGLRTEKTPRPRYLLSAYNTIYQQQRITEEFQRLLPYQSSFVLRSGSLQLRENLLEKSRFLDYLKGDISRRYFIQDITQKRETYMQE